MDSLTPGTQNFAFLIGCGASLWLATNLQLRYANPWATGFVLLVMLLLMLVAVGVLTPKELLEEAKTIQSD